MNIFYKSFVIFILECSILVSLYAAVVLNDLSDAGNIQTHFLFWNEVPGGAFLYLLAWLCLVNIVSMIALLRLRQQERKSMKKAHFNITMPLVWEIGAICISGGLAYFYEGETYSPFVAINCLFVYSGCILAAYGLSALAGNRFAGCLRDIKNNIHSMLILGAIVLGFLYVLNIVPVSDSVENLSKLVLDLLLNRIYQEIVFLFIVIIIFVVLIKRMRLMNAEFSLNLSFIQILLISCFMFLASWMLETVKSTFFCIDYGSNEIFELQQILYSSMIFCVSMAYLLLQKAKAPMRRRMSAWGAFFLFVALLGAAMAISQDVAEPMPGAAKYYLYGTYVAKKDAGTITLDFGKGGVYVSSKKRARLKAFLHKLIKWRSKWSQMRGRLRSLHH